MHEVCIARTMYSYISIYIYIYIYVWMYTLNTNFCILTIQFVGLEAGKQV